MKNFRTYTEERIGKELNDGEVMTYDQLTKAMLCKSKLSSMLKAYKSKLESLENKTCGFFMALRQKIDIKNCKSKIEEIESLINDIKEEINDYMEIHSDDRDLIMNMYRLTQE